MPLVLTGAGAITGLTSVPSSGLQLADANMPAGSVLQVVSATTTSSADTTSSTYIATPISVTITPTSATSKILILHNGMINVLASSKWCWYTLYRNSTNLATSGAAGGALGGIYNADSSDTHTPTSVCFLDSPATTSATTYAIYIKTDTGARGRYNSDGWFATINALEIAG